MMISVGKVIVLQDIVRPLLISNNNAQTTLIVV